MSIVWLASYPKSGNTWLRAVLTRYLNDEDSSASINHLVGGTIANQRWVFDEYVGLASSDMTPNEILRFRPLLHERLAAELPSPAFIKVHDACIRTAAGPLFPRAVTAGVIHLVRNPLDVALSWAHHQRLPIDRTVAEMNRPIPHEAVHARGIRPSLPEVMLPWSAHVSSWLESDLPLHVVRYEEMLADPWAAFGGIVRFIGLKWDESRLAQAIDYARFDRLRAQEAREGFGERQPTAPSFFRAGTSGGWRNALSTGQVRAIVEAHAPIMERFGYLREAEAFLADAGATAAAAGPRRPPGSGLQEEQ